jgi:ribonuclease III
MDVLFKDPSKLEQALTHSSYINENPELAPVSNERLEFLGDAVLGLIIGEFLFENYSGLDEGDLTRMRSLLVRQDTLARVAATVNLGEHLFLGKGEEASGGRNKPANLASGLEAVIAAVFLDQGLVRARSCVLKLFEEDLEKAALSGDNTDYKSALQHLTQLKYQKTPGYQVIETRGPDHAKTFIVEVSLGEKVLGQGSGKSKKSAETEAARLAIEKLNSCPDKPDAL